MFNFREDSIEKFITPVSKSSRPPLQHQIQVSKLAMVNEEAHPDEVEENFDTDDVTFIQPPPSFRKCEQVSDEIEERLMTSNLQSIKEFSFAEVGNTKYNFSQERSISRVNQSLVLDTTKDLNLISSWNLPISTVHEYQRKGIEKIFDWQSECLQNPKVLFEGNSRNFCEK